MPLSALLGKKAKNCRWVSPKRKFGFDRVGNNCGDCHTQAIASAPIRRGFVNAGPNHRLELEGFFRFLVDLRQNRASMPMCY